MIAADSAGAPAATPAPPPNVQVQPAAQQVQQVQPAPQQVQPAQAPVQPANAPPEFDLTPFIADAAPAQNPAAAADPLPAGSPAWMQPQAVAPDAVQSTADQDIARLQGQVDAYRAMQQHTPAAAAPVPAQAQVESVERLLNIDIEDLTPEERETYQGSIPVMEKLMRNMLMTHVDPALATLRDRTDAAQQTATTTAATTFDATLNATVPDLQQLASNPHFVNFAAQPIPYTGGKETVRSRLKAAYEAQDTTTISGIMAEFRTGIASAPVVNPAPPAAAFQAPQTSPPTSPVPRPAAPVDNLGPMLKMSKRTEASALFRKGRIDRAQLDQIDAVYTKAFAENRVDMTS